MHSFRCWTLLCCILVWAGCDRPPADPVSDSGAATDGTTDLEPGGGSTESEPGGGSVAGDAPPAAPTGDGAGAVALQVLDFKGIEKLVASHRGKVVVMDAWSTSCPPCIKEFPNLVALHGKFGADRLACISLSFDYEGLDTPEELMDPVLGFLKQQGATFDNVISSVEADELYKKFDLASIPAVFVYDRSGALRQRFDPGAEFTYEDVGKVVAELMAERQ